MAAHGREWLCHRILFQKLLEEGADLVLLEVGVVEVEGEFGGEHEQEDEEAEEDGGVKLSAPDAEGDASDHDEGAEGCKGTEEEDAGSTAEIGRGDRSREARRLFYQPRVQVHSREFDTFLRQGRTSGESTDGVANAAANVHDANWVC